MSSRRLLLLVVVAFLAVACASETPTAAAPRVDLATTTAAPGATTTNEAATRVTPATAPAPAADLQALADAFAADMAADIDAGGVIVALAAGPHLHLAAAGTQPDGSPVPAEAPWRIGSVSKPFAATLVLQLVDEGLVDLDAPVNRYVTEPVLPEAVTVRDLLGHTSGIFNYTDDIGFVAETIQDLERRWDPAELVARALATRDIPDDPPFAYSNTNYLIAGLLVEAVTGRPFEDLLESRIAAPLDLEATYLAGAGDGPPPVGAFTAGLGETVPLDASIPYTSFATGAWTAGAIVSNGADLVRFLRGLFDGRLVSKMAFTEMLGAGVEGYGLGIGRIQGIRSDVWGHGGLIAGYTTQVAYSPTHDIAVVVGITTDDPPRSFERAFTDVVLAAIAG